MICEKMSQEFPDESTSAANKKSNGNVKMGPNITNKISSNSNCSC